METAQQPDGRHNTDEGEASRAAPDNEQANVVSLVRVLAAPENCNQQRCAAEESINPMLHTVYWGPSSFTNRLNRVNSRAADIMKSGSATATFSCAFCLGFISSLIKKTPDGRAFRFRAECLPGRSHI